MTTYLEKGMIIYTIIFNARSRSVSGAYLGFSKRGGKEPARSTSFEPKAASGEQRAVAGVRGVAPRKFCAKLCAKPIGN